MLIPAAAYRRGLNRGDPSPFYTPALAQQSAAQNFLNSSSVVDKYNDIGATPDPNSDWAAKALATGANASKLVGQSAQNAVANQLAIQSKQLKNSQKQMTKMQTTDTMNPTSPVAGGGDPKLSALLRALGSQESGNNFGAVNSGSGALGQWQVMPSNVAGWSQQALGHSISTQQFLHDPSSQQQIVRSIFGNYVKKYGARGALAAWYSGNPGRADDKSSVHGGPSVFDYVNSVLSKLG